MAEAPSFEDCATELVALAELERDMAWRIGDVMTAAPPESAGKLASVSGLGQRRLQVARQVAVAFPEDVRGRWILAWSFHRAVAPLAETDPKAAYALLDRAQDEGWTLNRLGRELKGEPEAETHVCPDCGKAHRKAA